MQSIPRLLSLFALGTSHGSTEYLAPGRVGSHESGHGIQRKNVTPV
jgi:hypothetical protein